MAAERVRHWMLRGVIRPGVFRGLPEDERGVAVDGPWPEVDEQVPVLSVSDLQREIDGVRNRHGMDPAAMSALGELAECLDLDEKGS